MSSTARKDSRVHLSRLSRPANCLSDQCVQIVFRNLTSSCLSLFHSQLVKTLLYRDEKRVIFLERVAPFGSFLREFYIALWDLGLVPGQGT